MKKQYRDVCNKIVADSIAAQNGESAQHNHQHGYAARAEATFPECYSGCSLVKMLGVGECESACPDKFRETSA